MEATRACAVACAVAPAVAIVIVALVVLWVAATATPRVEADLTGPVTAIG